MMYFSLDLFLQVATIVNNFKLKLCHLVLRKGGTIHLMNDLGGYGKSQKGDYFYDCFAIYFVMLSILCFLPCYVYYYVSLKKDKQDVQEFTV